MSLKTNLDYFLEKKGFTYKQVSELAGISEGTLHAIKSDEGEGSYSIKSLKAVAQVLGVSLPDLLKDNSEPVYASGYGLKIRKYRKARGLTQEQLAEKLGVSKNTVNKWEAESESPSLAQAEKLSEALEIHYWLMFEDRSSVEMNFDDMLSELGEKYRDMKADLQLVSAENSVLKQKLSERINDLTDTEVALIKFLRTLSETELLPKLYAVTGDFRYIQKLQNLVSKNPTSDQGSSHVSSVPSLKQVE